MRRASPLSSEGSPPDNGTGSRDVVTDELKETFFLECQELLESLEAGLMSIANGDADDVEFF